MPKLPDVSGYSFDELSKLVALATKRTEEIRGKRIKELQAELGRLDVGGDPALRRGREKDQTSAPKGTAARNRAGGPSRKGATPVRRPHGGENPGRGGNP